MAHMLLLWVCIVQVTKQTRFFNGLYSSKEMDGKSIQVIIRYNIIIMWYRIVTPTLQERDDKVAFLQKAIDTLCKS